MALKKSPYALGTKPAPVSGCAADLVVQRAFFPVGAPLAANDVVELAVLPPYHYLVGARLYADGVPAASLGDVTFITGNPDDPDAGRVPVGPPLLTDAALNDAGRLVKPIDQPRGIGVAVAAAIAAGAKTIYLDVIYAQG